MNRASLMVAALLLSTAVLGPASPALAQAPSGKAAAKREVARPTWYEMTAAQREALAPLRAEWDSFDADRKRKWIEMAAHYPRLSPDGKARFQQRAAEFSRMSPEQRETARKNFQHAYELPADRRQSLIHEYQTLPEEEKKALQEKAKGRR